MSNTIPARDLADRFGGQGAFQTNTPAPTPYCRLNCRTV